MLGINPLVVLIACIVSLGLGIFWYSRFIFGRTKIKSSRVSHFDISKKTGIGYKSLIMVIAEFVTAYALAYLIALTGSYSPSVLFELIFWIWLGFSAAVLLSYTLREGQPWSIYFIDIGYHLISWTTMGFIIVYLSNLLRLTRAWI
jgi:L-asparagine transporter-like permease